MVSAHNPFRTPAVTPVPTGASVPSASSSASFTPSSLPVARPSRSSPPHENGGRTTDGNSVSDILNEELPPAYTAAPNVYEGEATIALGPRRPFQQPMPVPQPSQARPQFPPQSWGPPQPTGSSWSSFPGHSHREQYPSYVPPQRQVEVHTSAAPPTSAPLSDFARDFYAAGANDGGLYGGSSAQYRPEESPVVPWSESQASTSTGSRYAPPDGPPPPPKHPARRETASPSSPVEPASADDGRPTVNPVPGRPLLRHGKVLVYPNGFQCHKCYNTGYRNYDPSYPCARCWEKYAKPYAGAIKYAPWGSTDRASSSSSPTSDFQRPLPTFRAPQSALHTQSASWSGPSSSSAGLSRASTTSRASGYPGAGARVIPVSGGALPMSPYLDVATNGPRGASSAWPPTQWGQLDGPRGPNGTGGGGVTVLAPGDARLGGRLCWRCGGRGTTSFLIFDEQTCGVCNGVGRTFV